MYIPIISSIIEGVSLWSKGKQELKKVELEAKKKIIQADADTKVAIAIAKMKMAAEGQIQDFNLDQQAMKNMKNSWKDEFILIIFLTPMIMAFTPFADKALEGFAIIDKMPEWYQYIIIGMVVVIYGMRGLLTKVLNIKGLSKGKQ